MTMSPSDDDDTTPLLSSSDAGETTGDDSATSPNSKSKFKTRLGVVLSLCAVLLILDISNYIAVAPETAILEDIVCQNYYRDSYRAKLGDPDVPHDERCKVEPVQSELALINGWKDALDTLPGILCSIPYGALSDRIGRKKVLLFSILGCLLSDIWTRIVCWFPGTIPVRAVWLSGAWQFLGGGATTMSSMLFVMVADSCSPETRTTAFSQIHAAFMISEFLSVPVSAALMTYSPWIPYLGSTAIMFCGFLMTLIIIPDTFTGTKTSPAVDEDLMVSEESSLSAESIAKPWQSKLKQLSNALNWMKNNPSVILVLLSFFVSELGRQAAVILLQYASKKFHWKFAKVSLLISVRAAISLLVITTVVPALSYLFLERLQVAVTVKDKRLTQISGVFLIVGALTTFLASTAVVLVLSQILFALGFAFKITARSFITSLVEQKHLGALYTAIATISYAGILVGSPLLAASFSWGMRLGDFWTGLPFLIASGLFTFATLAVSLAGTRIIQA